MDNEGEDDATEAEAPRSNAGRPTEYQPEFCQKAADLCVNGATDFEVAEELGVSARTIYRWKAQFPEFRQALKIGKELADDRVEFSLYHRAVGYSHDAVKIMQNEGRPVIVPYTEHYPPDVGAATMWLTNRRGEKWRSKQDVSHSNPDGSPLVFQVLNYAADPNSVPLSAAALSAASLKGTGSGS